MKPIRRHRTFIKNFKARVGNNPKHVRQFEKRLKLFNAGVRETEDYYEFLDIGSHNQVY